ncbi:hypothetical protein APHAL10511_001113 [Amanita phalloides]|nr:hypothetical protein APHAL10511_001113 [Amanita phalloides]
MGHVIWLLRMGKLVGGHTLPRTYSALTKFTPATSGVIGYSFTEVESAIIVETCKKLGFTFGNALPVLGQVSLTRLLCRWYTQGKISVEEWEFRKKEPMPTAGPLNLRPFLDRGWHDSGGANNICLNIGFFFYRLPFMPLGAASRISPGDRVPSYSELLSPGRFSLRSKSLRKQATQYIYHPLFGEIGSARMPKRLKSGREIALTWAEERSRCHNIAPIPASEQSGGGFVISHGGSSLGNVSEISLIINSTQLTGNVIQQIDNLVPQMYNGPRAKIKVKTLRTVLNCRPAELYLGSSTFDKQLNMSVYWDKNVYDEATVVEWLADIVEATQHYLGGDKDAKL